MAKNRTGRQTVLGRKWSKKKKVAALSGVAALAAGGALAGRKIPVSKLRALLKGKGKSVARDADVTEALKIQNYEALNVAKKKEKLRKLGNLNRKQETVAVRRKLRAENKELGKRIKWRKKPVNPLTGQ